MATQRLCSIPGCGKKHKARGWCIAHYDKFLVYGDPLVSKKITRPQCNIDGCNRPHYGHGFCVGHLRRSRIYGNPEGGLRSLFGDAAKFYIETVLPYSKDKCLIWPYYRSKAGYAKIWMPERSSRLVCRLVCEDIHGPAPTDTHQAAHICGNGHLGCCSPKHCVWKTPIQNNADKLIHGTHNRGIRNYYTKLTENDVRYIRSSTKPVNDLAKRFCVNPSHISAIRNRRAWGWLD